MFIKLLKEPLVQFFLVGFILYGIYIVKEDGTTQQNFLQQKSVVLPRHIVQSYGNILPFDQNTTQKLLAYNNILLEESYFLELYKQDKNIQKILIAKMELLLNQQKIQEPTEKELYAFYTKHSQEYADLQKLTFVLLDVTDLTSMQAMELTQKLNLLQISVKGLPLKSDITLQTIKQEYGNYFYHQVIKLFSHHWSFPILAKNKTYLVFITKKDVLDAKDFISVERRVYQDYMFEKKLQNNRDAYQKIAKHYKIEIR